MDLLMLESLSFTSPLGLAPELLLAASSARVSPVKLWCMGASSGLRCKFKVEATESP